MLFIPSLKFRTPDWPATSLFLAIALTTACRGPQPAERDAPHGSADPPTMISATLPPVRFGEEAKTPYFRMRMLNTKPCAVEPHLEPPPGVRKVSVEVELVASGKVDIPANPFYALLVDRDGRQFESTLAGCSPLLEAARLSIGQSARGWVTFDVPESSIPHALVYQPAVIGITAPKVELLLSP